MRGEKDAVSKDHLVANFFSKWNLFNFNFFFFFALLGIKPRALHVREKHSAVSYISNPFKCSLK